jgi:dipeptidyl aminopeptidase/acylaminoacyl peptidase
MFGLESRKETVMKSFTRAVCLIAMAWRMCAGPPAVLDRQLFFGDPEISGARLSPDGQQLAFLKPFRGVRNIWIKKTNEDFATAKPLTAESVRPIGNFLWTHDGKWVIFVQDNMGDENYQVYAVRPTGPPLPPFGIPSRRVLTDLAGVHVALYVVSRSDPDVVYIGINDRDRSWHDLYRLRISTGQRTLIRKNLERVQNWIFDNKDRLRLAIRSAEDGRNEVLRVDGARLTEAYSCDLLEVCEPLHFEKGDQRVYLETNKGPEDLSRLVLIDVRTRRETLVEVDPEHRVDFGWAMFSEVTNELLSTNYRDDRLRVYWKDSTYRSDYEWLVGKLPGMEIGFISHTDDDQMWLISARNDIEPGEIFLFQRHPRRLTFQYRLRERLARVALSQMSCIRYASSDGMTIPAYLTLPSGVAPKNLPLIVVPHGGPWGRDIWGYYSYAQFWANRGYVVLSPNFRGSTGYGKRFLDAGNREWGDKMQDDITWGVKYLIADGIVDSERVGIMGGSYGGYAALAGVAFTPDVYAAAVSISGPSNLTTLMESIPRYWEPLRKMFQIRMGDASTPEGKAQLQHQSPLYSAAKIKTPLMVVQGANDPRVNRAESDQIVMALCKRGFPVEYLVAPDEGHGFARPLNNMALMTAAEKFFALHIGGRFQADAPPEVAARLNEITVDLRTIGSLNPTKVQ